MPTVEIIGIPQSTYTRVVRIACEEKGVPYSLHIAPPHTPDIDAIHPFGKVPALRHGDVELCESSAIARYLDASFDGPKLYPADPRTGALTEKWVSLVNSHMDRTLVRQYLIAYFFPQTPDKSPDRAKIDAVVDDMRAQVALLDRAVAETGYLAGGGFTFADANIMPILAYLKMLPESGQAIAEAPQLSAYFERNAARPSFVATTPPPVPGR
jgi:glutathione S-transferase